jgi:hypothetical protein
VEVVVDMLDCSVDTHQCSVDTIELFHAYFFMSQQDKSQTAKTMINPPPERIIWCYKRWQPLFSEMQSTIKNILFLQGLPENLNDDSFIDTRYPSLIVIGDLMRGGGGGYA